MSSRGADASVAPSSLAALSCSVVTDRSWGFAGMTGFGLSESDKNSGNGYNPQFRTFFLAITIRAGLLCTNGPDSCR